MLTDQYQQNLQEQPQKTPCITPYTIDMLSLERFVLKPMVALYRVAFCSGLRLLPLQSLVILLFTTRCWGMVFPSHSNASLQPRILVLSAGLLLLGVLGIIIEAIIGFISIGMLAITLFLLRVGEDGVGHRLGAEGFEHEYVENTLEALRELIRKDNEEHLYDKVSFPFIEFDVYECRCGELVIFHDITLERLFPNNDVNAKAIKKLHDQGIELETCRIRDITYEQLSTLCLGGRKGLKVPTFTELLQECIDLKVHRPLAVEVKGLHSDPGRRKFLELLVHYKTTYADTLDNICPGNKNDFLGWLGVIAFPHYFAYSFGEFGTESWYQWAKAFQQAGIPARCVHCHQIDYIKLI